MNKIIHLSLARKNVPILMDIVQSATVPSIEFVLDDYIPPSNARVRIYIKKDGGEVYNNCTLSGNVITYTPTAGSFDVPGECLAQLEIVQGSTVAVSWRIFVTVEPNLINGSAAPASTEYGALTQLIINAQRYDSIIGANNITGYNKRQGWIALTAGQDLNSVTAPGVYYSNTNANTNSLINCPFENRTFVMVVRFGRPANGVLAQTIHAIGYNAMNETAERYTGNGGSSWVAWQLHPTRSEVNAIANRGGKNLLNNTGASESTVNGITFTKNDDGSITATGTATANATYSVTQYIDPGVYTLTGCPSGGGGSTYNLTVVSGGSDTGNGFTWTQTTRQNRTIRIYILPAAGEVNLTFYPMIRDASIQDDTYVPYGMSNAELTQNLAYQPGETVNLGTSALCTGMIDQQGKRLVFFIPLPKSPLGRTVAISSNKWRAFGPQGKVTTPNGGGDVLVEDTTVETWTATTGIVVLSTIKEGTFGNIPSGDGIVVSVVGFNPTFILTFS